MGGVVFAQQDDLSHQGVKALEGSGVAITTLPVILLLIVIMNAKVKKP